MTAGRRLGNFVIVLLGAVVVWILAQWLWPYLELVAPVGALIILLLAFNVIDGFGFALRHWRRLARSASATRPRPPAGAPVADSARSAAVELRGTR